jgi:hypothetical protein
MLEDVRLVPSPFAVATPRWRNDGLIALRQTIAKDPRLQPGVVAEVAPKPETERELVKRRLTPVVQLVVALDLAQPLDGFRHTADQLSRIVHAAFMMEGWPLVYSSLGQVVNDATLHDRALRQVG